MTKIRSALLVAAAFVAAALPHASGAQLVALQSVEASVPPLFATETPLTVTFTTDLRRLRADKDTNSPWREGTIAYDSDTGRIVLPARMRTRGKWRLKNCAFPPVRLDFASKDARNTVFDRTGKTKLVNFCRDTDTYEQYILQEFQLYRVYQQLTPVSNRVRLLRMAYVDGPSGETHATRYAFLTEDPDHLARRFNGTMLKAKGATADDMEPEQLALAYLFEFMIGNTDFSFNGLHNTQLIGTSDGRILPAVYDFDYAGAVNTTYATPDPSMRIRNVRQRKFRGYCAILAEYPKVLPLFHEKKAAIYGLYRDEIGRLLHPDRVRNTLEYFDEFYEMIATPSSAQSSILENCVGPR